MGVREWSSCDGDRMAQMDPAATKTASSMADYSGFEVTSSPTQSVPSRTSDDVEASSLGAARCPSAEKLIAALKVAADRTATSIAHGTKQTRLEVRERLNEVIGWVIASLRAQAE